MQQQQAQLLGERKDEEEEGEMEQGKGEGEGEEEEGDGVEEVEESFHQNGHTLDQSGEEVSPCTAVLN